MKMTSKQVVTVYNKQMASSVRSLAPVEMDNTVQRNSFIKGYGLTLGKLLVVITMVLMSSVAGAQLPAFPGAEGFGATSVGGRGGEIIYVTTLDDGEYEGTLRWALTREHPRIIVFKVGGIIDITDDDGELGAIKVRGPSRSRVTVAGQTAPGSGITIRGGYLEFRGTTEGAITDIVIRHIRVRPGIDVEVPGQGRDAITGFGVKRFIVDHVSATWANDEALTVNCGTPYGGETDEVTFQRCLMAEMDGPHNTGSILSSGKPSDDHEGGNPAHGMSSHHNLFVHISHRFPNIKGRARYEVINNVAYNWQARLVTASQAALLNHINNYYRIGPATDASPDPLDERLCKYKIITSPTHEIAQIYTAGNLIMPNFHTNPMADNWGLWEGYFTSFSQHEDLSGEDPTTPGTTYEDTYRTMTPHLGGPIPVTIHTAEEAFASVLADVGANARLDENGNLISNLDSVDQGLIDDVMNGGGPSDLDSRASSHTYPPQDAGTAYADMDEDGMADTWEIERGLDPTDPSDGNETTLSGGTYTNVEMFLNGTIITNVLAHYSFDEGMVPGTVESIHDISNNSLHGTAHGVLEYTTDLPLPSLDLALDATADFDFGRVPDDPKLEPTGSFTIEAYAKPQYPNGVEPGTLVPHYIMVKQTSEGSGNWLSAYKLDYNPETGRFATSISYGGTGQWVASNTSFLDDQWHHVAATYEKNFDGSNSRLTLYVDGIEEGSKAFPTNTVFFGDGPLIIGAGNFATPNGTGTYRRNFIGLIDEVRISNQALDPADFIGAQLKILPGQSFNIAENSSPGDSVGTVEILLPSSLSGPTFTIESGNEDGNFEIGQSTGEITVAPGAAFDITTTSAYILGVKVSVAEISSPVQDIDIRIITTPPPPSTVVHYSFNDGNEGDPIAVGGLVVDSGPHSLDGTGNGSLFYTTDTPGVGGAAALDATADMDFVEVSDDELLQLSGDFTVEAFVKPRYDLFPGSGGVSPHYIVNKLNTGSGGSFLSNYALSYDRATQKFRAVISLDPGDNGHKVTSDSTYPSDDWYHLACTYSEDSTTSMSTLSLYVNGVLDGTPQVFPTSTVDVSDGGSNPLVIGAGNFATAGGNGSYRRNFIGLIDEVRISNEALDPADFLHQP